MRQQYGLFSFSLTVAVVALSGCGLGTFERGVEPVSVASSALVGSVHGGQQPVVGATVTLMVPGTIGYGAAPTVLATATSLAGGGFTLPSYTCPANSGDVYLLASGGNSGSGTNPALVEAALLGPCNTLSPATFISVTEVTTVAAAYALAQFAVYSTNGTNIGAPASNLQGLTNAFGAANNMVPYASGYARSPGALAGMVLPQAELNTLANILASCVNSTGSTTANAPCGILFTATKPLGGLTPVDTFQAMLSIAANPGASVSTLYNLSTANAPFQPTLTAAPNDFALGIQYTGGGITGSYGTDGMAIDTVGNAWIVTGNTTNVHSLTEISPAGVYLSGATGYGSTVLSAPQGIAIDAANNVYVTDLNLNKVVKFASNGSLLGTFAPASLNQPLGIVIDTDNTLWVANNGGSTITHLTAAGTEAASSPYTSSPNAFDIALNAAGLWTVDFNNGSGQNGFLTNLVNNNRVYTATQYAVTGHAQGAALDRTGDAFYTTVATGGSTLGRENAGGGNSFTPVVIPAQYQGLEVFIDGYNTAWVTTENRNTLSQPGGVLRYTNTLVLTSPAAGYTANNTIVPSGDVPEGIAVDGSGNLWITGYVLDYNGNAQPNAYVTELIGIAGPVVTPIAVAAATGALGSQP